MAVTFYSSYSSSGKEMTIESFVTYITNRDNLNQIVLIIIVSLLITAFMQIALGI